jgi:hypothetical protein
MKHAIVVGRLIVPVYKGQFESTGGLVLGLNAPPARQRSKPVRFPMSVSGKIQERTRTRETFD